jgi:hypothetical protein
VDGEPLHSVLVSFRKLGCKVPVFYCKAVANTKKSKKL